MHHYFGHLLDIPICAKNQAIYFLFGRLVIRCYLPRVNAPLYIARMRAHARKYFIATPYRLLLCAIVKDPTALVIREIGNSAVSNLTSFQSACFIICRQKVMMVLPRSVLKSRMCHKKIKF